MAKCDKLFLLRPGFEDFLLLALRPDGGGTCVVSGFGGRGGWSMCPVFIVIGSSLFLVLHR